jgi:hypothetical protein
MKLDLGSVGGLRGGLVGRQFDRELARVIADCHDRPGNTTARSVTIRLDVSPVGDDGAGTGEKVDVVATIRSATPAYSIQAHQARVRRLRDRATGQDQYVAEIGADPEDSDQLTLDQAASAE